jgi:uncharacterized membrane protein
MKTRFIKMFVIVLFLFSVAGLFPHLVHADSPDELDPGETYARAKVLQVLSQGIQNNGGFAKTYNENLKVQFVEGNEKGNVITVGYSNDARFGTRQVIHQNDLVVIDSKPDPSGKMFYVLYDPYRLNTLWWILGAFALLVLAVIGKKGIGALVGLGISIMVILYYIMPNILKGQDALTVCITGAIAILFVTTYVAHGISVKTTIALVGTAISLILAAVLSYIAVQITYLLGIGDPNSYALQISTTYNINPQGVFLGGIIIGTLGALNDITTTQSITIFTLAKENPKQHISHLYWESMHIGREHIISMINTLVLAYAGTSLTIFLFFAFNPANLPWWLLLNDQATMEEIIRAIVGSAALILAVPITTLLASYVALGKLKKFKIDFV